MMFTPAKKPIIDCTQLLSQIKDVAAIAVHDQQSVSHRWQSPWSGGAKPPEADKKLSYRRRTALCVVSIEILPIAMQQCRNYLYDKS